jgi:D-alanyl-lipoteichoic acid acyltransferase DltB (MBOAT superfamily)
VQFNSWSYVALLVAVVAVHRYLPKRGQNLLILAASYLFYGAWDWRFLSLLWFSTIVDYAVGRALGRTDDPIRRRRLLWASLATNLGLLATFKYFDFFTESFANLMADIGWQVDAPTLQVILPVGISFYTFQTLSYTIDVYRRELEPTRDPLAFAVYVAFFPQLVAGPIERAGRLLPQFETRREPVDNATAWSGIHLIAQGLVKKVAIADLVAPYVADAFGDAADAGAAALALGVIGFGLQIYGDFSGYTDIARGSSRLLGIELIRNFEQPYLSTSITDFWRRWHMSLSTWLRDYLYIPLGGNRTGHTARNLMITMLLGGLWHGAAWTFVLWGGLHGLYLMIHRRFGRRPDHAGLPTTRELPALALTWVAVHLAWVLFRAEDLGQAWDVVGGIATMRLGWFDARAAWIIGLAFLVTLAMDVDLRRRDTQRAFVTKPAVVRGLVYGLAAVIFVVASGSEPVPFIYFQF